MIVLQCVMHIVSIATKHAECNEGHSVRALSVMSYMLLHVMLDMQFPDFVVCDACSKRLQLCATYLLIVLSRSKRCPAQSVTLSMPN